MRQRAALFTFAITSTAYAFLLGASVYWLDSGELAGASFELGIPHAPGQPLAMLLGKLFAFVPLGDQALRAGLAQLFCGAGAAALVAWLGATVAARFGPDARAQAGLGVLAGLLYAGSYAAAFQAIRPEVYALSALLVLGVVVACVRFDETGAPGALGVAGLLFGLGLANHHYLTLLGAAPPAIALLARRPDAALKRGLGLGALGTAAALLVYAYLPLRAAHDPIFDWGHPTSAASFLWTVSARSFQKSAGAHAGDLPGLVGALADQLTPAAPLLALAGAYLLLRRAPRLGACLLLALAGPVAARLAVAFDAGNPDAYGYLSTAIAALALLCVPLVAVVLARLPPRALPVASAVVPALALALGIARTPALSLAGFEDARAVYAPLLSEAATDALVVPAYFQTTFTLDYLRVVEGLRPDLSYLPRHALDHPGAAAALLRRDPRLAPLLVRGGFDAEALAASPRPVIIEYDLDLDRRLVPPAVAVPVRVPVKELQSRRFALWQELLVLHKACRLGAPATEVHKRAEQLRGRGLLDGEGDPFTPVIGDCAALAGR